MQSYIWFPYTADVRVEHFATPVIDLRDEKGHVLPPTEPLSPAIKNKKTTNLITENGEEKALKAEEDANIEEPTSTIGAIQHITAAADELSEQSLAPSVDKISTSVNALGEKTAGTELKKKLSNLGGSIRSADQNSANTTSNVPLVKEEDREQVVEAVQQTLTIEARQALRHILYSSLRDINLRNVLDGCLLPPPLRHPDLNDPDGARPYTRAEVVEAARKIPRELVPMLVSVPLNFALTTGVYDARLRATMKRLAHLLEYPVESILEKEEILANVDMSDLAKTEAAGVRSEVEAKRNKVPVKRIATIGAISLLGAAALVVTGGLAAPLIVPAFTAVVGAAVTTVGAAGALGGVILGGTAIAAVFASVVGVTAHAAALAILITPLLTTTSLTAIFGIGGAGLAAYKANKRLGAMDEFRIRSIDEVESHPPLELVGENVTDELLEKLVSESRKLNQVGSSSMEDDVTRKSLQGLVVPVHVRTVALINLAKSFRFKSRRRVNVCGIECRLPKELQLELAAVKLTLGVWAHVPPHHIPSEAVGLFLSHNRPNYPTGTHGYVCYRIVVAEGVDKSTLSHSLRTIVGASVWLSTGVSLTGTTTVGFTLRYASDCPLAEAAGAQRKKRKSDKMDEGALLADDGGRTSDDTLSALLKEMDRSADNGTDMVQRLGSLEVEGRLLPKPHLIIRVLPDAGKDGEGKAIMSYFHEREINQQLADAKVKAAKSSRAVFVVVKNSMSTPIGQGANSRCGALQLMAVRSISGSPSPGFVPPTVLPVRHACIIPYVNSSIIPSAVEVEAIFIADKPKPPPEVVNHSPLTAKGSDASSAAIASPTPSSPTSNSFFVRVKAKVSFTNTLQATAFITEQLPARPTKEETDVEAQLLKSKDYECCRGSPYACVAIHFDEKASAVVFEVKDPLPAIEQAIEEDSDLKAEELRKRAMSISIAATGYITLFDPRVPAKDQQVAVWQPTLTSCPLFAKSEQFVIQWDNEQQSNFFSIVGLDTENTAVSYAEKKAKKAVVKQAKTRLMQGALFAVFTSYRAFWGVFDLPMYAVWASDAIDNSFATLRNRSKLAGRELASALLSPERGNRPVTLTGFSFGANVIFECLLVLFEANALAVVEDVYLLGACLETDRDKWRKARQAVGGRLVNVYNRSDWVLWVFHKANSLSVQRPLAGLSNVAVPGVENVDASAFISSHGDYALHLPKAFAQIPLQPTPETCRVNTSGTVPGAKVPASDVLNAADRILGAMQSSLSLDSAYVLSYTNRLVVDVSNAVTADASLGEVPQASMAGLEAAGDAGDVSFVFIGDVCYGCQFDFSPPPVVDTGDAGVSGILCPHRSVSPCCVAGFAAHMGALSDTILVVLVFTVFDNSPLKREVKGACKAIVVPDREGDDEDEAQLGKRLRRIVEHYSANASAIEAFATSTNSFTTLVEVPVRLSTPSASPTSPKEATVPTISSEDGEVIPSVDKEKPSTEYQHTCPIKIAWTWKDNHFTWAASGILTRDLSLKEVLPSETESDEDTAELLDPIYRAALGMEAPPIGRYLDADVIGSSAILLPLEGMHNGVMQLRKALCTPPRDESPATTESVRIELVNACYRSCGFAVSWDPQTAMAAGHTREDSEELTASRKASRFEATLAAVQRRTVVVVQPIVIANCSSNNTSLCLPEDNQSLMAAAEGLQWLRMPPPLIGAGQCTMLAFRWRVDPYSVFKAEVDRVKRRPLTPDSPTHVIPTSVKMLLSSFSLVDLVDNAHESGRSTYIIRIIATLTCEDFIAHPLVTTNISVSCLADTSDDKHRQSVTSHTKPLKAAPEEGLEEMQYQCLMIPAGGAIPLKVSAETDKPDSELNWLFF